MQNDTKIIQVVAPSGVSTDDTLTTDLTSLGIPSDNLKSCNAEVISKKDTSGNGKVFDDIAAISGDNLVITEGATGFTAGDVFTVLLIFGSPNKATAASSAA